MPLPRKRLLVLRLLACPIRAALGIDVIGQGARADPRTASRALAGIPTLPGGLLLTVLSIALAHFPAPAADRPQSRPALHWTLCRGRPQTSRWIV